MHEIEPYRITFSHGTAAAVNRRFISGFFLFAFLFAGAAFYRPAIQAFAVGFPIYLVLWKLRLHAASRPGWVLSVSREVLSLEAGPRSMRVERENAERVRIRRRESRLGPKTQLSVLNSPKTPPFRVAIDPSDLNELEAALAAQGWPAPEFS